MLHDDVCYMIDVHVCYMMMYVQLIASLTLLLILVAQGNIKFCETKLHKYISCTLFRKSQTDTLGKPSQDSCKLMGSQHKHFTQFKAHFC